MNKIIDAIDDSVVAATDKLIEARGNIIAFRALNADAIPALEAVTKELRLLMDDTKCDHSVGICFCRTFRALDKADEVLKKAKP